MLIKNFVTAFRSLTTFFHIMLKFDSKLILKVLEVSDDHLKFFIACIFNYQLYFYVLFNALINFFAFLKQKP